MVPPPFKLLGAHPCLGNKPDFHGAMKTEQAKAMYEQFLAKLGQAYDPSKIQGTAHRAMWLARANIG